MNREKEERSRSTASSVAGVGSLRTILWLLAYPSLSMSLSAYSNVEDLHVGGEGCGRWGPFSLAGERVERRDVKRRQSHVQVREKRGELS